MSQSRSAGGKLWASVGTSTDGSSLVQQTNVDQQELVPYKFLRKVAPFCGKIILFMQMELCSLTLRDWLNARNSKTNAIEGFFFKI